MERLNRGEAVPLYRQLKEIIAEGIRRGEFRPGERLPTEKELCQRFGVSRITVRQALSELVHEGLLYRHRGSGTFVSFPSTGGYTLRAIVPSQVWLTALRKAVQSYNADHPGEGLRLEARVLSRPQLHEKIVSAVGRGEAPDLALIDWVWLTEFADLHYIEPLDELDREWVKEFTADLFPLFVANNSYRGHFYGVQIEASVAGLWYRRDLLAAEGLSPPRTWDELIDVALHMRKHFEFPVLFPGGPAAGETTTFILTSLIWSTGSELISVEGIILEEGAYHALQFLHDLVHRYRLAPPDVTSYGFNVVPQLFARGEAALAFGGSYEKALIQEVAGWDEEEFRERVGFMPIPAGPGPQGSPATTAGGMVYVIFQQSTHPHLALDILKILSAPPLMMEFCRKTARKPTRISVTEMLDPEKDWFIYETSKLLKLARVRPTIPQYAHVSRQLQEMVASALLGEETVESALARTRMIIEALG